MPSPLLPDAFASIGAALRDTNADLARRFPGESVDRQPVHTVYGGAHLFKAGHGAAAGGDGDRGARRVGAESR